MPTLLYGNKHPIVCAKVDTGYAETAFRFETMDQYEEFFDKIDRGLVIVKKNGEQTQTFDICRTSFNVLPYHGTKTIYLKFTDSLLAKNSQWIFSDEFVHLTPSTAVSMASEFSSTILHMLTGHFTSRKAIRVYHRAPVEAFAHVVLKNIGLSRIKQGLSRDEFYREFTPDLAAHELKRILRKADLSVQFIPHDGKKRQGYCSLFGENIIEFAEQDNVQ